VILLAAGGTYARAGVWSDAIVLWEDTVRKAPNKPRVRFQLGYAYFSSNPPQYQRAVAEFEKAAQLGKNNYNLLVDWGLAYDGAGRMDDALAKLRTAAMMEPTAHVYTQIAVVYAERQRWPEALDALATAEKLDPNFAPTYVYRGNVFIKTNRCAEAAREYQRALAIQPDNEEAKQNLQTAQQCLLSAPH
jgi:tetratricopeptide (TPR) repeat protein